MRKNYLFVVVFIFGLISNISAQNELVGNIYYRGDTALAMSDVVVSIYDLSNNLITSDTTDEFGAFEFLALTDSLFYVRSSADIAGTESSLTDLYLILQNIFGFITLNDMEFESADVDDNNSVSYTDFSYVLSNIIFNTPLPGDKWQFGEAFIDMTNRSNDSIIIRDTLIDWGVQDGDVEGVWEPSGRLPKILNNSLKQITCNTNEIIEVTIGSDYENIIKGLNLNIKYPAGYEIVDVIDLQSDITYNIDVSTRTIKLLWLDMLGNSRVRGNNLVKLRLKANSDIVSKVSSFELLPGGSIIDEKGKRISDINISLPSLKTSDNNDSNTIKPDQFNKTFIVNAYPNPVINNMNIDFTIAESGNATIKVYSMNGNLAKEYNNIYLLEGNHSVNIDLSDLQSGQYFYKVILNNSNFVLPGQFVKTH